MVVEYNMQLAEYFLKHGKHNWRDSNAIFKYLTAANMNSQLVEYCRKDIRSSRISDISKSMALRVSTWCFLYIYPSP